MREYNSTQTISIRRVIELLNEMGYVIISISNSFYSSNEFETQDPGSGIHEHTLYGKDLTTLIENSVDHKDIDLHRQREIRSLIDKMKLVRRRFHKDITYVIYAATI